jgi:hypothetical protein
MSDVICIDAEPHERRRHRRTPVGVSVRVHFAGRTMPTSAELIDLSPQSCYLRGVTAPTNAKLALGFILHGKQICLAAGSVVRVDKAGFAMTIRRCNPAFSTFQGHVCAPTAHAA